MKERREGVEVLCIKNKNVCWVTVAFTYYVGLERKEDRAHERRALSSFILNEANRGVHY